MSATDLDTVSFELERFERGADELVEVSGRWFGVRGRRFVRPTLTVVADGRECRALAVLEHKPWAPDDGQPWVAAFPWQRDLADLADAELSVAPGIAVSLPAPSGARPRPKRRRGGGPGRRLPARAQGEGRSDSRGENAGPHRDRSPSRPGQASESPSEGTLLRGERDELRRALAQEREQSVRLRTELDQVEAAKLETASALARREAAIGRLDQVTAERDAARHGRDEALAAQAELERDSRRLTREREEATREREQATREREQATREREEATREREEALSRHEARLEQRHEALQARFEARLHELLEELEGERAPARRMAGTVRDRDASVVRERDAFDTRLQATVREPDALREANLPVQRGQADWNARALAALVLLAFGLLLIVILLSS
jgi:hypothetical protein